MKTIRIYKNGDFTDNFNYQIDEKGTIYSLTNQGNGERWIRKELLVLKPQKIGGGKLKEKKYQAVTIEGKINYVHHLMIWTFLDIDFISQKKEINHIDGNKSNNSIENLEIVTRQENIAHAKEIGLLNNRNKYVIERKKRESYLIVEKNYIGEILNVYKSADEAQELTGIPIGQIRRKCQRKWNNVYICIWEENTYNIYDGWYNLIYSNNSPRLIRRYLDYKKIKLTWNNNIKKDYKAPLYFCNRYEYK
jgi:hypothetical protein